MFNLKEGMTHSVETRITNIDLADFLGTAKVQVLSTSSLIRFMEKAAFSMLKEYIPAGFASVSTEINIKHLLPTYQNVRIKCNVHLKFIDGNKLFFDIAVVNEADDLVARGAHERRIVNVEKFLNHDI